MQAHEVQIHNQQEWDSLVLQSKVPVIVDFWANWCPPCKKLKPVLEEAAKNNGGKWVLAVVDVDQAGVAGLAGQYASQGIPSVYLFKGGVTDPKNHVLGFDQNKIKALIETAAS